MYEHTIATTHNRTTSSDVVRAVTAVWLAVSAINVVVWLLICVIGGHVDAPWFLWSFAGGGAVVGALRIARHVRRPNQVG